MFEFIKTLFRHINNLFAIFDIDYKQKPFKCET